MQAVAAALIAASVASCGKLQEDNGAPNDAAGNDAAPANDAALIEVRPDGCPARPSDLRTPCELGAECKYYDQCTGWDDGILVMKCEQPFEKDRAWYPRSKKCSSELDANGCPYGGVAPGSICSKVGFTCRYDRCVGTEGTLYVYECDGKYWRASYLACTGDAAAGG